MQIIRNQLHAESFSVGQHVLILKQEKGKLLQIWKQLGMDISGPFENKYYLLGVIDYYSRFPLVEVLTSTTSQSIINHLRKWFSIFGFPKEIRSDNAPNMVSEEMEFFFKQNGIKHSYWLPFFPKMKWGN